MRAFAATALLSVPLTVFPQYDVLVHGTIRDHAARTPLSDARVVTASERGVRDTVHADTAGGYEVHLPYGRLWQMRYEAPGRVPKLIAIDTRGIPTDRMEGGHGMNVEMKLFASVPDKDYSALEEPMGLARYVDSTGNIEWDLAMVERMKARIAELVPEPTVAVRSVATTLATPVPGSGSGWETAFVAVIVFLAMIVPVGAAFWWFFVRGRY